MDAIEPGSFMARLTPVERADLERRGRVRRWARGAVIFREGELPGWVVVLRSGKVKASSHGENGVEVLLAVRGPGALVGEVSAIDGQPRSATVATLEPAETLVLTRTEFLSFLEAHNRVSLEIMRVLCHRWRDADRKRVEFGMLDATGRVAQRLLELAERYGVPCERTPGGRPRDATAQQNTAQQNTAQPGGTQQSGAQGGAQPDAAQQGPAQQGAAQQGAAQQPGPATSVRITLSLTQEELAGWVGASREAVSKALRTLRAHGWIETGRRRVIVHDMQALRRHAGR